MTALAAMKKSEVKIDLDFSRLSSQWDPLAMRLVAYNNDILNIQKWKRYYEAEIKFSGAVSRTKVSKQVFCILKQLG